MNSQHSRTPTRSPSPPPPAGLSIDLNDIFYVFFRRWKMILLIGLLSIPAAIYCYFKFPPMYTSEAKVMVRYVQDRRSIAPGTADSSIMSTDSRGDNIMNSQLMIFQSFDLALAVADKIGPEKILAALGGGTNRYAAAGALARGTRVDNPRKSNIIIVSVSHPDPTVVQPALQTLLDSYVEKHVEIYQNKGVIEDLQRRQRDLLRTALIDTETQLINIQTNSGILSIEDSRRSLSTQISRLEDEITTTEINLAGARVLKAQLERTSGRTADTNQVDSTNAPSNAAAQASTPVVAPTNTQPVTPAADLHPSDKVDALAALDTELETLKKLEKQQLRQYTEIHPGVKRTQRLLKETQTQIEKMESENVGLRAQVQKSAADRLRPPTTAGSTGGAALASVPASTGDPLQDAISRIAVLESTRIALKAQHDKLQRSIGEIVSAEHKISQLRRTKELQEKSFSYYQSGMDQAAADEALGPGKFTGIERVQNPSLPASSTEDRVKYVGGSAVIPWVLAFLIAFALDLLLDRSLRKPSDVERRSGVPLFISLPDRPAMVKASKANEGRKILQLGPGSDDLGDELGTEAELPAVFNAPLEAEHGLDVYFETLRDRITNFFDKNSMTHKPKLLGITGCQSEVGVTSIVAGLAASLSRSDEGNVLVVDMKSQDGAVKFFKQGKAQLGLVDALDEARREEAQVGDNLYVVSETHTSGNGARFQHKRFLGLVPKLKLSNYDYIIFDLPTMSQTSLAPRVARYMDLVLVVAESERTPSEFLKQSAKLLGESGTNVGAILNRTKSHVPKRFSSELGETA